MSDAENRAKSAAKVQQIMDLARSLQLTIEAAQKVDMQSGLISLAIIFKDNEQYAIAAPALVPVAEAPAPEASPQA